MKHDHSSPFCDVCYDVAVRDLRVDHSAYADCDMNVWHLVIADTFEQAESYARGMGWMLMEWRFVQHKRALDFWPNTVVHVPDIPVEREDLQDLLDHINKTNHAYQYGE